MRALILFSVVSLQICWTYGVGVGSYNYQDSSGNRYGGVYDLKDGQEYNFPGSNGFPFNHVPEQFTDFQDVDSFFPEYFRNLENLIQEHIGIVHTVSHPGGGVTHQMSGTHYGLGGATQHSFQSSTSGLGVGMHMGQLQSQNSMLQGMQLPIIYPPMISPPQVSQMPQIHQLPKQMGITPLAFVKSSEDQKKALDAARKAFDLTSNRAGFNPDFGFDRFPSFPNYGSFGRMPQFGMPQPQFGMPQFDIPGFPMRSMANSAFAGATAGAAAGPGYQKQAINLYPSNPQKPNIQVSQFSDPTSKSSGTQGPGFFSVQSSSFSSSSNINGKPTSHKGGETIVNNNGKITKYSLND